MLIDIFNFLVYHTLEVNYLDIFCLEYFGLRATCLIVSPKRTALSAEIETAAIICSLEASHASSSHCIMSKFINV